MMPNKVIPAHYAELRLICWHSDPEIPVTEEQAFGLYERNWRYVDHAHLTEDEKGLINHLKETFGNGVING